MWIVCFAYFEIYNIYDIIRHCTSEVNWHRRLEVTKKVAVVFFWKTLTWYPWLEGHHRASSIYARCQVFISHCWGRKGFVCSGTSAAVEQLEKTRWESATCLTEVLISLWMIVGDCQIVNEWSLDSPTKKYRTPFEQSCHNQDLRVSRINAVFFGLLMRFGDS